MKLIPLYTKQTIQREAKIWAKLDHPNILSFIGTSDVFQPQLALISPWMENGTVIQYVKINAGVDRRKLVCAIDIFFFFKIQAYNEVLCRSGKLRGVYSIYTIVIHQLFTVICGLCVYLDNMLTRISE